MSAVNRCPRCGTELSSGDAQGICPKCLLKVGMEIHTATGASQSGLGCSPAEMPTESDAGGARAVKPLPKIAADLPEPGQQFGNYRLIRRLGKGGMGQVFEADDLESGRRVALKLLAHSLESPEARNRFFREGRLAASINHPVWALPRDPRRLVGRVVGQSHLPAAGRRSQPQPDRRAQGPGADGYSHHLSLPDHLDLMTAQK